MKFFEFVVQYKVILNTSEDRADLKAHNTVVPKQTCVCLDTIKFLLHTANESSSIANVYRMHGNCLKFEVF